MKDITTQLHEVTTFLQMLKNLQIDERFGAGVYTYSQDTKGTHPTTRGFIQLHGDSSNYT